MSDSDEIDPPLIETNFGKVCIVTGANTGIGLNASTRLARDGFEVILACRDPEKGQNAVKTIMQELPGAKVLFMQLDLASLKSIREFVDSFHKTRKPLHVLCNNAGHTTGLQSTDMVKTEDGFEATFGVNHLGHFLLTMLLLDDIKQTAILTGESRIVITASSLHDPRTEAGDTFTGPPPVINFDNLMLEKKGTFLGKHAYANSKLANILFTYELARRLEGTGVTANCFCPGFVPETDLWRNESWLDRMMYVPLKYFLRYKGIASTLEDGGKNLFYLAANTRLKGVTGKYWHVGIEKESSNDSYDENLAKRLWDVSAKLVGFQTTKNV